MSSVRFFHQLFCPKIYFFKAGAGMLVFFFHDYPEMVDTGVTIWQGLSWPWLLL